MLNIRSQQNEELMTSIGMTRDIVRKIIMEESGTEEEDGQMMWKNDLYALSRKTADRTGWHQMVKHA